MQPGCTQGRERSRFWEVLYSQAATVSGGWRPSGVETCGGELCGGTWWNARQRRQLMERTRRGGVEYRRLSPEYAHLDLNSKFEMRMMGACDVTKRSQP